MGQSHSITLQSSSFQGGCDESEAFSCAASGIHVWQRDEYRPLSPSASMEHTLENVTEEGKYGICRAQKFLSAYFFPSVFFLMVDIFLSLSGSHFPETIDNKIPGGMSFELDQTPLVDEIMTCLKESGKIFQFLNYIN